MPFLLWRQFAWKYGQNHTLRLQKGYFWLTCVAQKNGCLRFLIYSAVQWAPLFHHATENLKIKGKKKGRKLYLRYTWHFLLFYKPAFLAVWQPTHAWQPVSRRVHSGIWDKVDWSKNIQLPSIQRSQSCFQEV